MIEGAAANSWIDGDKVMMESFMAFKRAGCGRDLTYFAPRRRQSAPQFSELSRWHSRAGFPSA